MIVEAHLNKWKNPTTGNLYQLNAEKNKRFGNKFEIDPFLDMKYKIDAG